MRLRSLLHPRHGASHDRPPDDTHTRRNDDDRPDDRRPGHVPYADGGAGDEPYADMHPHERPHDEWYDQASGGARSHGAPDDGGGGQEPPGGRLGQPFGALPAALAGAAWQVMLAAGVAATALGVVILVWPGGTLLVVGVLFGVYLLVSGFLQLVGAFSAHVPGHLRTLSFVSGALCVLLGLICFRGAAESILLLALWIGFGWLLRGVMLAAVALSSERLPARGWQVFLGVATVLGGVVMIVSPFGSLAVLTVVAGIWLLALGVTEIVHAVRLRAAHRLAVSADTADAADS